MNRQLRNKIVLLTHRRDELITKLQNIAELLTPEEFRNIAAEINRLNTQLKGLTEMQLNKFTNY